MKNNDKQLGLRGPATQRASSRGKTYGTSVIQPNLALNVCGYFKQFFFKIILSIKIKNQTGRIRGGRGNLKILCKGKIYKYNIDGEESEGILLVH